MSIQEKIHKIFIINKFLICSVSNGASIKIDLTNLSNSNNYEELAIDPFSLLVATE